MKLWIFFYFLWSLLNGYLVNSKCPEYIHADKPIFYIKMPPWIRIPSGKTTGVDCCMYGVSTILWYLASNIYLDEWKSLQYNNRKYRFLDNNRTIDIIKPWKGVDMGYYRCNGSNTSGETLSDKSQVSVEDSSSDYDIKIYSLSSKEKLTFKKGSQITIFCAWTMWKGFYPHFNWYKIEDETLYSILKHGNITSAQGQDKLIHGYEGFGRVVKTEFGQDQYMYNFTLSLYKIKDVHGGLYRCQAEDGTNTKVENFHIDISRNDNLKIYILVGIILFSLAALPFIYTLRYDIKVFIKSIIRILFYKDQTVGKYNFFFIYDFYHDSEFIRIHKVVSEIESQGYSSYFHHRDQTYGKDTLEDLGVELKDSNVVVIWVSTSIWKNATCRSCLHMLINHFYNTKRVYVMNVKKKEILKYCDNKNVIADLSSCTISKLLVLDSSNALTNANKNILQKWSTHQLLSWLISSLPLKYTSLSSPGRISYVNETEL